MKIKDLDQKSPNIRTGKPQAPAPKTSFADTLATKKNALTVNTRAQPMTAGGQAPASNAPTDEAAVFQEGLKQVGLEMARSIMNAPKAGKIDREQAVNPEDED